MGYSNNKSYTEVIKIKEHREIYKRLFGGVKRRDLQLISARGCGKTLWLKMFTEDINKELCFGDNIFRELALQIDQKREELIQEAKLNV